MERSSRLINLDDRGDKLPVDRDRDDPGGLAERNIEEGARVAPGKSYRGIRGGSPDSRRIGADAR